MRHTIRRICHPIGGFARAAFPDVREKIDTTKVNTGIFSLFSRVGDVLTDVTSSGQLGGAFIPLTKCGGPFLTIG
ncbi:MAG: hypothetical protein ABJQ66_19485 [Paracoccaceae bacterium]